MNTVEAIRNYKDNITSLSRQLIATDSFERASWFLDRIAYNRKHLRNAEKREAKYRRDVAKTLKLRKAHA